MAIGTRPFITPAPGSVIDQFRTLMTGLGNAAGLASLVFAAYLIGLSWQALWSPSFVLIQALVSRFQSVPLQAFYSDGQYFVMTNRTAVAFLSILRQKVQNLSEVQSVDTNESFKSARADFAGFLIGDEQLNIDSVLWNEAAKSHSLQGRAAYDLVRLIPARIINDQQATWNAWDRLQGEADFRQLIAVPLLFLTLALTIQDSSWWALMILVAALLLVSGVNQGDTAVSYLIEAVRAEKAQLLAGNALPTISWEVGASDEPHMPYVRVYISEPRIT